MLVLTRKSGQSIRIGKDIIITVLENSASQIKLGINAPQEVPIHRSEVYERIQSENKSAVISTSATASLLQKFIRDGKK